MAKRKNFLQSFWDQIPSSFKSRYIIVLAVFFGWMIFFDKHDILTQWRLQSTVNKLEQDLEYYEDNIKEEEQKRLDLEVNKEKFAREQYFMKKGDEDVFIIVDEE